MEDFQDMLEAHSGIAPEDQDVLVGEPPRSLQVCLLAPGAQQSSAGQPGRRCRPHACAPLALPQTNCMASCLGVDTGWPRLSWHARAG